MFLLFASECGSMSTTAQQLVTAEQLLAKPELRRCELVNGEAQPMAASGYWHGRIAANLLTRLLPYVEKEGVGGVSVAEAGFLLSRDPDTVRVPDFAFVRAGREDHRQAASGHQLHSTVRSPR